MRHLVVGFIFFLLSSTTIYAAPFFTIDGSDIIFGNQIWYYYVYLDSDGDTLTAAHATIDIDTELFEGISFSQANSVCDLWAPPDPSVSTSSASTPFVSNGTIYMSCGFSEGGYLTDSGDEDGDLFLTIKLLPDSSILGPLDRSLAFGNELFKYIGSDVTAGTSVDLSYRIATSAAVAQPSATPTPTHEPADTLTADDLNFTEIGVNNNSVSTSNTTTTLTSGLTGLTGAVSEAIQSFLNRDDTIPPPPEMTPRPPVTPYGLPSYDATQSGEVLSVQSLRELLIPGVSEADSRVVFFNLIMSILFIIILALLIWRLHESRKLRSMQKRHIKDLLTGELSMLENKFGFREDMNSDDFVKQLKEIKSEIQEQDD